MKPHESKTQKYVGKFKSHTEASHWWHKNKGNYPKGYVFSPDKSTSRYK